MNEQTRRVPEVVIIGAGGAGLSTSYYLSRFGVEHVVFERGQMLNSEVMVQSKPGQGTRVTVDVKLPSLSSTSSR